LDNYRLELEVALPFLYAHGDYKINGRILVLPIAGSGDSWTNYSKHRQLATVLTRNFHVT
jgi:hypothetical protein